MESLCDGCRQGYNQCERQRIQLNCGDNICLQCFDTLLQPQDNKLLCPHLECGETLIINKRFYDNIQKMRENNQGLMIFCEKHSTQATDSFCQQHNILICDKCALIEHNNHVQSIIEVKRQNVEGFCDSSIKHLITLKNRIDMALESLTAYKSKSKSFISDQIMALVLETQDILLKPHLKNDREKESLQFPAKHQQAFVAKEELKINPQEEVKAEQPQVKLQPEQQQRQPNYAQPHPQQQVQNQNSFETQFDQYSRGVFLLDLKKYELLQKWIGRKVKFQLTFRASRDGFTLENVESQLADCKPNITIIKSEHDQIFGGYASVQWEYSKYHPGWYRYNYCEDKEAFIFQLTKETKHQLYDNQHKNAICYRGDYIVAFGQNDLSISEGCNQNSNSNASSFGKTYRLPDNIQEGSKEAQSYLAGSPSFKVKEIEIYKVINE